MNKHSTLEEMPTKPEKLSINYGLNAVHTQMEELWYFMQSQKRKQKEYKNDENNTEEDRKIFFEEVRIRKKWVLRYVNKSYESRRTI